MADKYCDEMGGGNRSKTHGSIVTMMWFLLAIIHHMEGDFNLDMTNAVGKYLDHIK